MPLNSEQKREIVAAVHSSLSKAHSLVVADMSGVKVDDLTSLRQRAREQQVELRVVKNTLVKRAVQGTDFEVAGTALTGPSLLALSLADPGAGARLFKDFSKENDSFSVTVLVCNGRLLGPSQIDVLADLPTRDQALAMLAGLMLAPVSRLAVALNDLPSRLVRVLTSIGESRSHS